MKTTVLALVLSICLFGCKPGKLEIVYTPKAYANDDFNEFPTVKNQTLNIVTTEPETPEGKESYEIKFKDTTVAVQDNPKPVANKFKEARFINTQKTAALVQVEDGTGLVSPFYVVSLTDGKVSVTSLYRESNGKNDKKYTKGIQEMSLSNIIVNNDFAIALVNGKIYPIKRQHDSERIQGEFLFNSSDKKTLVFVTGNSLYQVNYRTGETNNLTLPAKVAQSANVADEIRRGYSWATNGKGTSFLKQNPDEDRIVDISEFKK
ncbi:hypothetical protein GJU39_05525 [Pedobacter petrophilus]|uniref:Uncharacterized protein n=1 Tax=Pedobacter petrophilus TaxID=1908241 RepID=A0A7K0FWU2_9SPHI|nr:hypothetical protein [Pedobacter petrophilus]MRX75544.1 hypothetical protein [Pedobacter petrophilus]